jgi:hypothetical protein
MTTQVAHRWFAGGERHGLRLGIEADEVHRQFVSAAAQTDDGIGAVAFGQVFLRAAGDEGSELTYTIRGDELAMAGCLVSE